MNTKCGWSILFSIIGFSASAIAFQLEYWSADLSVTAGRQGLLNDDVLNPGNRYLSLPDSSQTLNMRPELRWELIAGSQITLRPIFDAIQKQVVLRNQASTGRQIEQIENSKLRWNEVFLSQNLAETAQLTYGLQSYQWGPAEIASPSNFIFKDTVMDKDSLYLPRGLHLLRVNFSPSTDFNEVFMAELSDNGDADYNEGQDEFSKKALLKSEWLWGHTSDYVALVLGWQDRRGINLGEYFSAEFRDGFYFYFDLHHEKGSDRWRPYDESNGLVTFVQDEKNKARIFTYAVSGLRYNFEGGGDLRFEFTFEEDAYNKSEQELIHRSFSSQLTAQQVYLKDNLKHYFNGNLHYKGQKFTMLSYSKPNLFDKKNFLLAMKGLYSLTDFSLRTYLSLEKSIGNQATVFAFFMHNRGLKNSELNRLVSESYNLGYKYSF
jgi:hypothetical protein